MGDEREPKRSPARPPARPAARREPAEPGHHILGLQRSAGNASVARLLDASPQALDVQRGATVQRAPGPTEFHPLIFEPAAPIRLRVFSPYTQQWSMVNFSSAPKGSRFQWGWALEAGRVAKLTGSTTTDHGATTTITTQARAPGTFSIQGTPVHQVPGGPEVTGDLRRAQFVVDAPTLRLVSLMGRKPDGAGVDTDHLSVGDHLVVRVVVGGVDGAHMEDPSVAATSGAANTALSGLSAPVQSFPDGRSYDVQLTMTAPGTTDMAVELGLGDMVLGTGPKAEHIRATAEFDRQTFINLANQCQTRIDQAYTQANSIMEVLSSAYGNAYDAHLATLRAQDASNRIAQDILLGAALAFIPGGVGGVVGAWMKDAGAHAFLIDAVKDLAKAGVRGTQAALAAPLLPGADAAMKPMGEDPRTWRAEYAVRVNAEKQVVLGHLDRWLTGANQRDPGFAMDFDPLVRMQAALTKQGAPVATTPVPDQGLNQKQFELGMWKAWLEAYGYTAETKMTGCSGTYTEVTENQGKKIRDRLNHLGVDGDAWLEQYGGVAKKRAEDVRDRRSL